MLGLLICCPANGELVRGTPAKTQEILPDWVLCPGKCRRNFFYGNIEIAGNHISDACFSHLLWVFISLPQPGDWRWARSRATRHALRKRHCSAVCVCALVFLFACLLL